MRIYADVNAVPKDIVMSPAPFVVPFTFARINLYPFSELESVVRPLLASVKLLFTC